MFCPYCGYKVTEEMHFCTNCGKKLQENEEIIFESQDMEPEPEEEPILPQGALEETKVVELPSMEGTRVVEISALDQTLPEVTQPSFEAPLPEPEPVYVPPQSTPVSQPVGQTGFGFESQQPARPKKVKQPREKKPRGKSTSFVVIGLIVIVVLCVLVAAVLLIVKPAWLPDIRLGKQGSSDFMVLLPQRDDTLEIEYVTAKESVTIAEDVTSPGYTYGLAFFVDEGRRVGRLQTPADFIPGTDLVLQQVVVDDEFFVYLSKSAEDPENLIFSTKYPLSLFVKSDGSVLIIERRDSNDRVYLSEDLQEAERIYKGETVIYLPARDEFISISTDQTDDGVMENMVLVDMQGNDIAEIYDGPLSSVREITAGGKFLALKVTGEAGDEVVVIDLDTQKEISTNDDFSEILRIGSSDTEDMLYLVGQDEDGFLSVQVTNSGQWETVLEGLMQIAVTTDPQGKYMGAVTFDEEAQEYQVYAIDVANALAVEVYSSENHLVLLGAHESIPDVFIVEEEEEDANLITGFRFKNGDSLVIYDEGLPPFGFAKVFDNWIFIPLSGEEGGTQLWAWNANTEEGFLLLEDWVSKDVLAVNPDGTAAIVSAVEDFGDDLELNWVELVEDGDEILLDDEGLQYENAFFMPDKKNVLYTIRLDIEKADTEVRKVTIDEDPEIETVTEDASICAIAWWFWDFRVRSNLMPTAVYEGSASRTIGMDDTTILTMPADEGEVIVKLRVQPGSLYSVYITAGEGVSFDPSLALTTVEEEVLEETNYNADVNESVFFAAGEETQVFLTITNEQAAATDFDFEVWTVSMDPQIVERGSSTDAEISESDKRTSPTGCWYEDFYAVEIEANQFVTFEVTGNIELSYIMYILDADTNFIAADWGGTAGGAFVETTFTAAGTYYIIVLELLDGAEEIDPDVDHSYILTID